MTLTTILTLTLTPTRHDVRTELMSEAKAGLKARVEAELAAAENDDELKALRDRFSAEERALEHSIDHQVHIVY
jgi:ribosome assembly protein YihI (activator of Der GTPase)